MTDRPMTDGLEEQIARVIFSYGHHFFSDHDWAVTMAHRRTKVRETPHPKPTDLDHAFIMARQIAPLLSTSTAVSGMREALEEIAKPRRDESSGLRSAKRLMIARRALAALSPIPTQGDEQARATRSAPSSTLSKDTSK